LIVATIITLSILTVFGIGWYADRVQSKDFDEQFKKDLEDFDYRK